MAQLSSRFALLLLQITLFAAFCDALSTAHIGHRRSDLHHQHRRLDQPQSRHLRARCPNQNYSPTLSPVNAAVQTTPASASSPSTKALSSASSSPSTTRPASASSSVAPSQSTTGSLLDELFPIGTGTSSWTTCPQSNKALPLSDSTLRPTNILKALPHPYVPAPDGKLSIKAHYPKDSYTFTHTPLGGISFYAPGPANVDLTTAKEATFGYSMFFPGGFAFNKGGKLPGLYGGDTADGSTGCSGGSRDDACFSARLMWRTDGAGEFYTYLPPDFPANQGVCNVKPFSECNPVYGASVGRGSFTFATGQWTTVSERVRLNDAGQTNGELQLWVNGKSVINVGGLVLRDGAAGRIRGIQFQTFFGGSSFDFASPQDQDTYFSDLSVAITESL